MLTEFHMSNTKQISFIEKLQGISMSNVSFTSFSKDISNDEDGGTFIYYRLTLEKPIEKVVGSKTTYWAERNQRVNEYVMDVKEVCVAHGVIEAHPEGWEFEEVDGVLSGKGSYKGDLILDVSGTGQVWLTDVKFSKKSSDWRNSKKNQKLEELFKPKNS